MSSARNRLIRKIGFSLLGNVVGGGLGHTVGDLLGDALGWTEDAAHIAEIGLTAAGAVGGASVAKAVEKAIWSEMPPENPRPGMLWFKESTQQLYAWIDQHWVPVGA